MKRAIVTYAEGAHQELLEVALPGYKAFAQRHKYDLIIGDRRSVGPPAWNKVYLLQELCAHYDELVWFDCDLIVVDPSHDFPLMNVGAVHSLVRHFEDYSEVPNSGVWRLRTGAHEARGYELLETIRKLEVFTNHGWWEQAALMTLMGYTVPPEGSHFPDTKCKCVYQTRWYAMCDFMRLKYNSHPNYRASNPVIVHCSYPDMQQRLETMRALAADPTYNYPAYRRPVNNPGDKE